MIKDYFGNDLSALRDKKLFLFDMDGTIYLENRLFANVKELMSLIDNRGGKYVFVTNNSSNSVEDYVTKLNNMGIPVDKSNFFTSTQAAIVLLKEQFDDCLVYAQGTKSFIRELTSGGIKVTEQFDCNAKVVLVGYDNEMTSAKLRITCKMLTKCRDIPYYATNPDWVCPVEFGYVPDCGSMCFGIEKATGRTPIFIGKPNPTMINLVIAKFGVTNDQTVVVGDRLYTDIASGNNAGVNTVLVLSGESTLGDYGESQHKPTHVLRDVTELYKSLL